MSPRTFPGRLRAYVAVVAAAAAIGAGCAGDDALSLTVSDDEVAGGQKVEVVLSPAAKERDGNPGVTYLQRRGTSGRWRTTFALGSAYFGGPTSIERVREDKRPALCVGPSPEEFDREVVQIPDVRPGTYRLVKTLESDEDSGEWCPRDPDAPETSILTTEIRVVR